jgi:pimeloyl-ACP methyl ester carboxylesterase
MLSTATVGPMRVSVNGSSLYFDVEGAGLVAHGAEMRERPTVLLLHGGPGFDHSLFKPAYGQLADVAQVVYYDHRGNGRSDRGHPNDWNLDVWADDVHGLCDALGIERPIVLGWSFGGFVAMRYADRYPDHPAKLILQSTLARWDVDRSVEGFRARGGDQAAEAAKAFFADPGSDTLADFMQFCLPAYSPAPLDATAMARCVVNIDLQFRFFRDLDLDLTAGLANVRCPTLVVAGALDPITPLSAAEEIVAALPPDRVTYEIFDRSGHFIADTEPQRLFATVRAFAQR